MKYFRAGDPAPMFVGQTRSNPTYSFANVAGRYLLLGFTPADVEFRDRVFGVIGANLELLNDETIACFVVLRDELSFLRARDRNGMRWFFDPDGQIGKAYGAIADDGSEVPMWVLVDPSLRVLFTLPMSETEQLFQRLRALPPPDDHAGVLLHAPVMIAPRVFDPDLCQRLIAYYETHGGAPSGVMREIGGKTVGVLDDFKKRRDAHIEDEDLKRELLTVISRRLIPEVLKAFRFRATRLERYIVARYDAEDGGYFRPHRDNLTAGTAHRQFACSINLNAEDFEGGDLRFPEYGSRTYRPPTGGAVVFSCSLLHEATPVTRGTRFAFLPFLYDEAGETVRQASRHLVVPQPEARSEPAAEQLTDSASAPDSTAESATAQT
jgi:predicted 2-oxoglutarate/Fe(II)-dependent dioxygenase YbiX